MEKIIERLKVEEAKILKLLEENGEHCYDDSTHIKTANDYQIMVGLLVNIESSIRQFEQIQEMQKRNAEQVKKMEEEANKAKE